MLDDALDTLLGRAYQVQDALCGWHRALRFLNSDAQRRAHLLTDPDGQLARSRAFFAGRRSGKTTLVQHELIEAATMHPECAAVYVGPTLNLAVKTVWTELVDWSKPYGGVPNQSRYEILFPNGAKIYVLGAENKKTIDRIRGIKRIVYLAWDEQQHYDNEFALYALGSVIQPALADESGRLVLLGTGGPERGHWHHIVTSGKTDFVVITGWTWWDNPVIKDPDGELWKVCQTRGVTPQDPYVRREVGSKGKGIEFTTDSALSCFLPIPLKALQLLPGGRFVLGGDVGSTDHSGVAVYWLHPHFNGMVLVTAEKRKTPAASDQIAFFQEYLDRYAPLSSQRVLLALDPGGGGAGVIGDLAKLGGFYEALPATKDNKPMNVRFMASDVARGFLTLCPEAKPAADDLEGLEWKPGRAGEELSTKHAGDGGDAALYGYRLAKQLFSYTPALATGQQLPPDLEALASQPQALHDLGFSV